MPCSVDYDVIIIVILVKESVNVGRVSAELFSNYLVSQKGWLIELGRITVS